MTDSPTAAGARRARRAPRPPLAGLATVLAASALVAGCIGGTRFQPQPLPPQPAQPVVARELPPVDPPPTDEEPLGQEEVQVAALPEESAALEVARSDLVGGWALSSGSETCQLFMSLTQWTGGYRASTRGCGNEQLADISAWDLTGKTITLKDSEGRNVGTVLATGPQTFNGRGPDGRALTVSR